MMKIKHCLSFLLLVGHATTIFSDIAAPDVHKIDIFKIDDALQLIVYHSSVYGKEHHYLSDAIVTYQDQIIHHETWQQQSNPYTITFFIHNPVTINGKTYTVEVGDHIQADVTCSQGYHSTLKLVVQKAPDVVPHKNESIASEDLLTL